MLRRLVSLLLTLQLVSSPAGLSFAYPGPGGLAVDFLYEIASNYYQVGNFREALNALDKLLLIEPNNTEAVRLLEQIAVGDIEPSGLAADFLFEIGREYYKRGNPKEALFAFRKVLLLLPGHKKAKSSIEIIIREYPDIACEIKGFMQGQAAKIEGGKSKRRPLSSVTIKSEKGTEKELRRKVLFSERRKSTTEEIAISSSERQIQAKPSPQSELLKSATEQVIRSDSRQQPQTEYLRPLESSEILSKKEVSSDSKQQPRRKYLSTFESSEAATKNIAKSKPKRQPQTEPESLPQLELAKEISEEERGLRRRELVESPAQTESVEKREEETEGLRIKFKEEDEIEGRTESGTGIESARAREREMTFTLRQLEKRLTEEQIVLEQEIASEEASSSRKKIASRKWIKIMKAKSGKVITSRSLEGYVLLEGVKISLAGESPLVISPVLEKGDDIWFPLEEITGYLGLVTFAITENSLNIIRGDGLPLEIDIGSTEVLLSKQVYLILEHPVLRYEGITMVNLVDLAALLAIDTEWNSGDNTLAITKLVSKGFTTFNKPKPRGVPSESVEKPTITREEPEASGRLLPMPPEVQPDIRLNFHSYTTYLFNNLTNEETKSEQLRISGDIYDYRLDSEFKWKDKNNKAMVEDGKFIGIYGKDVWLKFLDLTYNLYPMRGQSESYEGMEITMIHEPFRTKIFGGDRDVTVSGPTDVGQVRYFGNILGIEQQYNSEVVDFKTALLGMDSEAETYEKSGTTSFPRRNLVGLGDTTLHMPYGVDLSAQYALCNYYSDEVKDNLIHDNNWRIGAKLERADVLLKYGYEYVGDSYASISDPSFYQDYKGWDLYSRYKLSRYLSFSGSYRESQDNVDDDGTLPTNKNKTLSLGSYLSLPTNTNISLSWSRGSSRTTTPNTSLTGTTSHDYIFNVFQNWKDLTGQFSYSHYTLDNIGVTGDLSSDTYAFSIYRFLPRIRGSYLRFREEIRKTRYKSPLDYVTIDYNTDLGFRYYFSRDFSTYGNWRLYSPRTEGEQERDLMSFNIGSEWNIDKDTSIGIDFNFAPYDLRNSENRNSDAWSILLRFSCGFDMSSPAKWSKIEGRVFIDSNENGVYDDGEPVLPEILIQIPKENVVRTDDRGHYILKEVIPGVKTVKLNAIELPIELISLEGLEKTVTVGAREDIEVNFPLIKSSTIKGRLFIDENNNGIYDIGEDGIEGVIVTLLMPEYRAATTDENGKFSFEYLLPGIYKIKIDPADMPMEYNLVSPEELEVELSSGEEISDVNFIAVTRPIIIKSF